MDKKKITETINSLIKKGYLKKDPDGEIGLTQKGLEACLDLDHTKKELGKNKEGSEIIE